MVRVVSGFYVKNFTMKQDALKVVLNADKDDVTSGDGDIGDVLESLELHSTAADSSSISAALQTSFAEPTTRPFDFKVVSFTVKQDTIKLELSASQEDNEDGVDSVEIVKALAIHVSGGENRTVELRMESAG